jgi:hypothetical protein
VQILNVFDNVDDKIVGNKNNYGGCHIETIITRLNIYLFPKFTIKKAMRGMIWKMRKTGVIIV